MVLNFAVFKEFVLSGNFTVTVGMQYENDLVFRSHLNKTKKDHLTTGDHLAKSLNHSYTRLVQHSDTHCNCKICFKRRAQGWCA